MGYRTRSGIQERGMGLKTYTNQCPNIPAFDISKPSKQPKSVASISCFRAAEVRLKLIRDDDTDFREEVILAPLKGRQGFHYHPVINGRKTQAQAYYSAIQTGRTERRPLLVYRIVESQLVVGGKLTLRTDEDGSGQPREEKFRIIDFSLSS